MAGHSKWANMRHRKGRADAKKGKIFTRVAKEIITAVKLSGSDPKSNPRLRLALQKARDANMPNDTVERNIKKALSADQADYTEMTYELYGYGGVGIMVDVMTDNKNRIATDMRIATNKKGGTIATPGSVAFNFERKGVLQIPKEKAVEEELFIASTEAGAQDFELADEQYMITTDPTDLYMVKEKLKEAGYIIEETSLQLIPKNFIECSKEDYEANIALIEWLEELDDVDAVFHNMDE